MHLNINNINIHYPNLFKRAEELYTYDNIIINNIHETYGYGLESIIEIHKYNQAIEDVRSNTNTNEYDYKHIAIRYVKLFTEFSNESFILKNKEMCKKEIYQILDILRDYFKNIIYG